MKMKKSKKRQHTRKIYQLFANSIKLFRKIFTVKATKIKALTHTTQKEINYEFFERNMKSSSNDKKFMTSFKR